MQTIWLQFMQYKLGMQYVAEHMNMMAESEAMEDVVW